MKHSMPTSVSHTADPSAAVPPTLLDSMRFCATMKRPRSKAKARKATVAANEAKTEVQQVPEKPRMWANRPSKVEMRPSTAAEQDRVSATIRSRRRECWTLTNSVQDENIGESLYESSGD